MAGYPGQQGRRPKPDSLKKLSGTFRPSRAHGDAPRPAPAVPTCPSWLKGEGRKEWRYITRELAELGVLARIDRTALATYCQLVGCFVESVKAGELPTASQIAQMRALAGEFGLVPGSRARLSVAKPEAAEDPFARIIEENKLSRAERGALRHG